MNGEQKVESNPGQSTSGDQITIPNSPPERLDFRDFVGVLAVAWAVRLAFVQFVPDRARSFDAFAWQEVAGILKSGWNPYQATSFLNYPPLWLQAVFCLSKIAAVSGFPFFRVLQFFLILVESGVIILLIKLIQDIAPSAPARKIAIFGLALNPIAILLICQHCQFDVLMVFWLMLFMLSLLRYNRARNPNDWLFACLFLGLGILTKTVPLLLIPMLAGGFRQAAASLRILGSALLLGPVTLGLSILYVLAPADVISKVLLYRSKGGSFGISGLLHMAGADSYLSVATIAFYVLLIGGLGLSWNFFWRRHNLGSRESVLFAAVVLALIPVLGPGYAPQYFYWFMPFLVATYPAFTRQWRWLLAGFALVSICTYLAEYGLLAELGANLVYILNPIIAPGRQLVLPFGLSSRAFDALQTETGHTWLRLPIFIGYLVLLAGGVRLLFRDHLNLPGRRVLVAKYPLLIAASLIITLGIILSRGWSELKPDADKTANGTLTDQASFSTDNWNTIILLNNTAWKLATSPDDQSRDGFLSVKLAERACELTRYQRPVFLGTLAAAYAESGRFRDAIATGQKACSLAAELGETNTLVRNRELLGFYQTYRAYREPPTPLEDSNHVK